MAIKNFRKGSEAPFCRSCSLPATTKPRPQRRGFLLQTGMSAVGYEYESSAVSLGDSVDRFAFLDCLKDLDVADRVGLHRQRVVAENDEVGEFTEFD
jgi:hypothetical protein